MPAKVFPRRGFTLVEVLVVMAIIAVFVGPLLPAVQAARESGHLRAYTHSVPVHDPVNAIAIRTPVPAFYCPSCRAPASDRNCDNNGTPPSGVSGVAAR